MVCLDFIPKMKELNGTFEKNQNGVPKGKSLKSTFSNRIEWKIVFQNEIL